ncbi:hypothetical protein [Sulfurovum mangrovi]|uniref:hypothetical protein n=1 Tax=Sulfurovum mangrovi TaxID=2893889 RepID=UPI001E412C51|nr:hypothetical protein [Sulfurovum mangrovi]UFH58544.1 hypothetical protein LN246_09290 [Sulfurovum mangrovi]
MDEDKIVEKVCLLALFKKRPNETLKDIQAMLVDTGMFDMKECKRVFKTLKSEKYISENNELTLKGITEAKDAEEMFKQP